MESLVHIIWIVGAASTVFAWSRMGLFGGPSQEELDAVRGERDELKKKLDRADVRVDEQKKKVVKLQADLEEAAGETKEVRRRAAEQRDECRKLQRQLEQLEARILQAPVVQQEREEQRVALKEEVQTLGARSAQLTADLEEARQQVGSLERDKARLEKAVEAANERAAAAQTVGGPSGPTERAASEPPVRAEAPPSDALKAKLRELKEALRIKDGLLRKLRTQAEHNRRAYVITQLQLELSLDEVYELKHGRPRRDTERSRQQRPPEPLPEVPDVGAEAPPTVELPEVPDVGAEIPLTADLPEVPEVGAEAPPTVESPPEDTV